jgi:kumamolisin
MFRAGKKVGPHAAGNASFAVPALAELYGFPTSQFTGKGQSIAIIELNDWDSQTHQPTGTGYTASDLSAYFKRIKTKAPTVIPVGVLGGANVPGLNPDADGEVALDIEIAGAVAPEATILVYFAPNTDRGFVAAIHAAVFDTVHKPSVISISWGSAEDFTKAQYRAAFDAVLQDAAAHNITVFVSSGDSGSSDIDPSDGKPHVDFPGSNDKAISCGGLKTGGNLAETVWNDGSGAGGGGVSNLVAKPPYQTGITVPKSPKGFTGRGVPDVSGDADPATGYQIVVGGKKQVFGGTSAVAPLYAGLFALINESRAIKGKAPAGDIHSAIYTAPAAFRDIQGGDNDTFGNLGKYQAVLGWDPATGLGSPRGDKLFALLG